MDQNETANEKPAAGIDRRNLLSRVGIATLGTALMGTMGPVGAALVSGKAHAQSAGISFNDQAILNFALNLEYLEGEYYNRGATGFGLPASVTTGLGAGGGVNGGTQVPFATPLFLQYAQKIALDELLHVNFLRSQLGSGAVAEPLIDLAGGFQAAALASGAIAPGQVFNPFANEANFFLGALALTQVGVSAYAGAAALIQSPTVLAAASSILAAEAYHLGAIRTALAIAATSGEAPTLPFQTQAIATFESNLSNNAAPGNPITEPGIFFPGNGVLNFSPTDGNGLAFRRTVPQVLNVVYGGNLATADKGGFFPNSVNGTFH